jgi:hypothetical protein
MSVLNIKDSNRLEVLRPHTADDPVYYTVMNRPLEDLEQRTDDLNSLMAPAHGLLVHETSVPSKSVEVSAGVYMDGDTNPLYFPQSAVGDTLTFVDAPAGFFRVDLIYFNLENGTIGQVDGTQTNVSWAVAWTNRGVAPLTGTVVPLAYVYVPDTAATVYQDGLTGNTAGRIRDARLSFEAGIRLFEDTVGTLNQDVSGGAIGTSQRTARADHSHPVNVDATNASTLSPDTAGSAGVSTIYSRSDHAHYITPENNPANLMVDLHGGALGVNDSVARGDHQHPLLTSGLPQNVGSGSSNIAGTNNVYQSADHRHAVTGLNWSYWVQNLTWSVGGGFADLDTGPIGFTPLMALVFCAGYDTTPYAFSSFGMATGTGTNQSVVSLTDRYGLGNVDMTSGWEQSYVAGLPLPDSINGYKFSLYQKLAITQFGSSNVRFSWAVTTNLSLIRGTAIIIGQS